jgi:hypothetical protein
MLQIQLQMHQQIHMLNIIILMKQILVIQMLTYGDIILPMVILQVQTITILSRVKRIIYGP